MRNLQNVTIKSFAELHMKQYVYGTEIIAAFSSNFLRRCGRVKISNWFVVARVYFLTLPVTRDNSTKLKKWEIKI